MKNRNESIGSLEVITGCMFSGKTEELLRRADRAKIAEQNVVGFSPIIDDRYGKSSIGSHNGNKLDCLAIDESEDGFETIRNIVLGENLTEEDIANLPGAVNKEIQSYIMDRYESDIDVIIIDEGNFFTEGLSDVLNELASDGYRVIVAGLDEKFNGSPFHPIPSLMATADSVEKLKAVCEVCHRPATKTQKVLPNGEPASKNSKEIDIGADNKYEARCRDCFCLK